MSPRDGKAAAGVQEFPAWGGGFYSHCGREEVARRKETWAGPSIARAFDPDTPWAYKQPAQSRFYGAVKRAQRAVARFVRQTGPGDELRVKPQLAPAYTDHPVGTQASIGLTAFLEAQAELDGLADIIRRGMGAEPPPPAAFSGGGGADPRAAALAAQQAAAALAQRQILAETAALPESSNIELYRLFQASMNTLRFEYLQDIINCVVLFGDVLPEPGRLTLHPMTRSIMEALASASRPFWEGMDGLEDTERTEHFAAWGAALTGALEPFLPRERVEGEENGGEDGAVPAPEGDGGAQYRFGGIEGQRETPPPSPQDTMQPLNAPRPPRLMEPVRRDSPFERLMRRRLANASMLQLMEEMGAPPQPSEAQGDGGDADLRRAVDELNLMAAQASGQQSQWEEMREDLLEQELGRKVFQAGPIEGTPAEGNSITLKMGDGEVGGHVYDRVAELCDELPKVEELRRKARPIARILTRNLYPSLREHPEVVRNQPGGQLDPQRLPIAEFSDAVFRRYRVRRRRDTRGRAVLAIAADGSGSLTDAQMRMCKVLSAAWLESARRGELNILASLYHSGLARGGVEGPMVQWIYHPTKTPAPNPREAVRAVASLPDEGTGCQSDALSLAHILDEAAALARGSQIYLVVISDCSWNQSFPELKKSGEEEVVELLKARKKALKGQLHVTLVSLESKVQPVVADTVDKVVAVSREDLENPEAVAGHIGGYVASCIRERRKTPGGF